MGKKRGEPVATKLFIWIQKQTKKVKALLVLLFIISLLILIAALKLVVKVSKGRLDHLFHASEAAHFFGIIVLIYKLSTHKTCSGLSLKTQELTALFLAARLFCSFLMEGDLHTVLDASALLCTLWVIYMMRFKLKSSYNAELDTVPIYYLVIPTAVLAFLVHPWTLNASIIRMLWAFAVYLESVSILPQLRLMQNAKMVETFTGHYVFALGVARLLGFAHWAIRVYETGGAYIYYVGRGHWWLDCALLSELVQTFILSDFCYYYVKSVVNGHLMMRLPSPV